MNDSSVVSFKQAFWFWLKLGFISFGGPAGQIAIMHKELVEQKRWISESRFLHALNYCMLLPGPDAQQLATYLGWSMHGVRGGLVAGGLFVLPSLLILTGLSWAYLSFGHTAMAAGILYGMKAAVVAVVMHAVWRVGKRTLRHPVLMLIALFAFIALFFLHLPFPLIVAMAAILGWIGGRYAPHIFQLGHPHSDPDIQETPSTSNLPAPAWKTTVRWLLTGALLWAVLMLILLASLGWTSTLTQLGWFFSKAALVTFGGAYAVLPYVVQAAVGHYGWLTTTQMMDGLALGETTPGPLIMIVAFVGFVAAWQTQALGPDQLLLAAMTGAGIATFFTFLPSFIFIFAGAPWVEASRGKLSWSAPLSAITAAVVGVIFNLALFFAGHVLWPQGAQGRLDITATLMILAALFALWRLRWNVIPVLFLCALAGWWLH
jgi:chromate transporter